MATCWDKIEDAIKAVLESITGSGQGLEGWTVVADASTDEAVDCEDGAKVIRIWTTATPMDQSDEQGQTIHTPTIELEFTSGGGLPGVINRTNRAAAASAHGALAADRTLGGRLQDLQETDLAPAMAEGKDTNAASLQYAASFFTPRDDWTTIKGVGGADF